MIKILNQFLKKHGILKFFYDNYDYKTPIEEAIKIFPKDILSYLDWDSSPQRYDFWYKLHVEWYLLIDEYYRQLKELLEQDMDKVEIKYVEIKYNDDRYTYTTTSTSATADEWTDVNWE